MKKSINERIHDLRERSGLTQSDLAIQLGMTSCPVSMPGKWAYRNLLLKIL